MFGYGERFYLFKIIWGQIENCLVNFVNGFLVFIFLY
jgi:hypothetical protein